MNNYDDSIDELERLEKEIEEDKADHDLVEKETESTRRRDELLEAAVFELSQQIQLTIRDIGEEKASKLMDLLRVQFIDIIDALEELRLSRDQLEIDIQSERVRQWLGSLSRSPFIPLSFRIKYLRKLENHLDLIARDMGPLVMRAYKVGILLIKDKAKKQPKLYQSMVYVTGAALELAVISLKRDCSLHIPASPLDVRQSFDMARLGLAIARTLSPKEAKKDINRLKLAMIQHELLRSMDLFRLSDDDQQTVYKRLPDFTKHTDIEFLRAGDHASKKIPAPYLISRLNKPHIKPSRYNHLRDIKEDNVFLVYGGKLFKKSVELINYTSGEKAKSALHLEHEFVELVMCAHTLYHAFQRIKRQDRKVLKDKGHNVFARTALVLKEELYIDNANEHFDLWKVMNLSKNGICLQGRHKPLMIDALVEVKITANSSRFAIVRWYQNSIQGLVECGLEFIHASLLPSKVGLLNNTASESVWLALLQKHNRGWNVWIGEWVGTPVSMIVGIKRQGKTRMICRIAPTGRIGSNYAVFSIVKVMSEEEFTEIKEEETSEATSPSIKKQASVTR